MSLPTTLDVAIGLVVLYFLLSTVCSSAVEIVAAYFWWRQRLLYRTIARLLTGNSNCPLPKTLLLPLLSPEGHPGDLTQAFWTHPLVKNLVPDRKIPAYIEPSTFAAVAVDMAVPGASTATLPATGEGIQRVLELAVKSGKEDLRPLRKQILSAYRLRDLRRTAGKTPGSAVDELREAVGAWYNEAMDRLTGQYKRLAQIWLMILGLVIAISFNADTIRAVYVLSTNDALRNTVAAYGVTLAGSTNMPPAAVTTPDGSGSSTNREVVASTSVSGTGVVSRVSTPGNTNDVEALRAALVTQLKDLQHLQEIGFPIGWSGEHKAGTRDLNFVPYDHLRWWLIVILKLVGLAVTALAVSLGAPFWFDLLNKLVSLRSAGKRVDTDTVGRANVATVGASGRPALSSLTQPAATATGVIQIPPTEIGKDLGDARLGFNVRKAYWCAEASLLAYADKESVAAALRQWSMDLRYVFDAVESAQGYLAAGDGYAVLAFRGTEKKLADWETDAEFEQTDQPCILAGGKTHRGFCSSLERVYSGIRAELAKLEPETLLYVTGHSLGAGLATLMAARLTENKDRGVHAVYTYGSPRVGDEAFAKSYEELLENRTFRFVNAEDLVTRVPPRALHYEHVGQIVFLDSDGRMHLNAGFWERFLNTVIDAVKDFRAQLRSTIKDHCMDGYVRLIKVQIADAPVLASPRTSAAGALARNEQIS